MFIVKKSGLPSATSWWFYIFFLLKWNRKKKLKIELYRADDSKYFSSYKTEWKKTFKNWYTKYYILQSRLHCFSDGCKTSAVQRLFISSDQIKKRKEKQSTCSILGESINNPNKFHPFHLKTPLQSLIFSQNFQYPIQIFLWFFIIYAPFPIKQSRACSLLICLLLKCSSEHFVGL